MRRGSKTQLSTAGRHLQTPRDRAVIAVIVEARSTTGLSQREFSRELGRSSNFMQRIEAGVRPVSVQEFIDIVEAAGMRPDELIRRVAR
jgi:transcriptional regulator with XRE-family HTH domain